MIYPFRCLSCKKESYLEFTFDEYSQRAVFICPNCGAKNMQRIFQPTPIIYKDDGFTKHVKEEN